VTRRASAAKLSPNANNDVRSYLLQQHRLSRRRIAPVHSSALWIHDNVAAAILYSRAIAATPVSSAVSATSKTITISTTAILHQKPHQVSAPPPTHILSGVDGGIVGLSSASGVAQACIYFIVSIST